MIRETGGWAEHVSDVEIVSGMQELAETEGIFTETAGGVTTAVTARLYAEGRISPDELTVSVITGNGLKTTDALTARYTAERAIRPRLADFDAYLSELDGVSELELTAAGAKSYVHQSHTPYRLHPPHRRPQAVRFLSLQPARSARGYRHHLPRAHHPDQGRDGKLRKFINIYINDEDIRFLGGDTYAFQDGDEVMLIPSIAGGRS